MQEAKKTIEFDLPTSSDLLKAGVQFGHQTKRWNPKMQKFIFAEKNGIHVIDISQTVEGLEKALNFLVDAASRGNVLFVGTKRQARDIVKETSIDAGAYFVTHRWVGGLLTNINYTRRSLKKLASLEEAFESGVEGRTKFEISRMRKEWERLNRLYEGVKSLDVRPTAVVVLDAKYEKNAIKEAKNIGIPVVAIIDTNSDPDKANYPVVGNDDAVSAIKLYFDLFAKAVKQGNNGKGVKHSFKDYSKFEIKIVRSVETEEEEEVVEETKSAKPPVVLTKVAPSKAGNVGILERVQKAKEEKVADAEPKKTSKKEVKKPAKKEAPKKKAIKTEKKSKTTKKVSKKKAAK